MIFILAIVHCHICICWLPLKCNYCKWKREQVWQVVVSDLNHMNPIYIVPFGL